MLYMGSVTFSDDVISSSSPCKRVSAPGQAAATWCHFGPNKDVRRAGVKVMDFVNDSTLA